ncbi:MAG: hypothetical protein AB8B58_17100 [Roseobacter sp.]
MKKPIVLFVILILTLSACSSQNRTSQPLEGSGDANPLLPQDDGLFSSSGGGELPVFPGSPINRIDEVLLERTPGGAIIRVKGVASVQGVYEVRLTPANFDETAEDGVLIYRLEGVNPQGAQPLGSEASRTVTAARRVTDSTLAGVRSVRVEGLSNAQVARR